jgi:diketogulonate reductase-like aldo/keto reductase
VGTYAIRGTNLTNKVVDEALTAGYRLFDSAQLYQNEKDLGEAFQNLLSKHSLTRSDIFITTKFCKLNWKVRER